MSETENVVRLGTITKLDLDPDTILDAARGQTSEVLVIGWEKAEQGNGAFYFAAYRLTLRAHDEGWNWRRLKREARKGPRSTYRRLQPATQPTKE